MSKSILKPTNDAIFKILFGSSSNTEALKDLIQSVIRRPIGDLQIQNPYTDIKSLQDKQTILDIKARTTDLENKESYNVELQIRSEIFFLNRSLYYWAKSYGSQLKPGDTYRELEKHICINFVHFLPLQHDKLHSLYMIREVEDNDSHPLTEHLELHFVQMPSLRYNKGELPVLGTPLEKWVYFLLYGAHLGHEEAIKLNPIIGETGNKLRELQNNIELLNAIQMREADDLARDLWARRKKVVEQISKRLGKIGPELPTHVQDDLMLCKEEQLDHILDLIWDNTDPEQITLEIKRITRK